MDPRQRIGKYELLELIGSGGMGTVYKAVDPSIGRTVALKLLAPGLQQNPESRERFLREARAAGRLQHPNIVVIYDLGETADPYIAMEFLEGETLADRLARGVPLPAADALEVMSQVARGLHYAHDHGVIHRDIKPHNIMVTRDGIAKIVDFGIARAGDQRLTKTGQVMGTIFYLSPEQINGKTADARSDIFAAGIVLYELLTGRVPFEGESTGATMMKILTEPTPPLRMAAPLTPPELDRVVASALAKDPTQRFQTAAAFAKALDAIRKGLPTGQHTAPSIVIEGGAVTAPYPVAVTGPSAAAARTAPVPAAPVRPARTWWTSTTLRYAFTLVFAALLGGGWWMYRASMGAPQATSAQPISATASDPVPTQTGGYLTAQHQDVADLNGTYDLFFDGRPNGEMTIYAQAQTEFSVRGKDWTAQGHIEGSKGYYDWRFSGGELAGQTGRTSFTVQDDGSLVGKVQGDKQTLRWLYLARPRKKGARPGPVLSDNAWLEGTWIGNAHQQKTGTDWTIRLVVSGDTYSVTYPSLNCGGYLTLTNIGADTATFEEHLTSGVDNCAAGVTVILTRLNDNAIRYSFEGGGDSGGATLTRQ